MILVTLGTNEQPFPRLVRAVEALAPRESLVVQYGSCTTDGGAGRWVDFLPFDELADLMREARVVVAHAGIGSVMLARSCGKCPIVVPRRLHLGEAVDDHQLPIARRLHSGGIVRLVEDVGNLAEAIDGSQRAVASEASGAGMPDAMALATDVRLYLEKVIGGGPGHRPLWRARSRA
jgi:exopolysaccharide biosynthesis glucuronosyltransferase PssE